MSKNPLAAVAGIALCSGIEITEITEGGIPEWAQVLKEGSYYVVSMGQVVDFTPALLAALAERHRANAQDIPLDYEHAIMRWILDPQNHERPDAEGWFNAVEYRAGDGLYARLSSLGAGAADKVTSRRLKYLSAGILWDAPDLRTGQRGPRLVSVSLTLFPNIYDLKPLAASAFGMGGLEATTKQEKSMKNVIAVLNAVFGLALAEDSDETKVAESIKGLGERIPPALASALGHPEKADAPMTVAQALAFVEAAKSPKIPATLSAIIGTSDVEAAVAAVATLKAAAPDQAALSAITTRIATLEGERRETYLNEQVAAGKIAPAARADFAALLSANESLGRKIIDALPSTGPLTQPLGPSGKSPASLSAATATDDEIAFIAMNSGGDAAKIKERMVNHG